MSGRAVPYASIPRNGDVHLHVDTLLHTSLYAHIHIASSSTPTTVTITIFKVGAKKRTNNHCQELGLSQGFKLPVEGLNDPKKHMKKSNMN
eukprot:1308206-Amphidinium_carterae.1